MSEELVAKLKNVPLFASLEEDELATVAGLVQRAHFQQGALICEQDKAGENFYIVESGQLLVTVRDASGVEAVLTRLGPGKFFGDIELLDDEPHTATFTALVDSDLLYFSEDKFKLLLARFPFIEEQLRKQAQLRLEGERKHFDWELDDEVTLLVARPHLVPRVLRALPKLLVVTLVCGGVIFAATTLVPNIVTLRVGLVVAAGAFWLLFMAWHIVDWTNDYYVITNRRVVHVERVMFLSETRSEAPIDMVQDVKIDRRGSLAAMLNYAHVRISTAGGYVLFAYMPNPKAVQEQIMLQQQRASREAREEEMASIRYELERAVRPESATPPQVAPHLFALAPVSRQAQRPASLWDKIGELAQVRIEREGQIIWRKHWLILLAQLIRPMALLAVAAFAAWLINALPPHVCLLAVPWILGLAGLGWFVWEWLDWGNDLYILTHDRIIDVERLPFGLKESRREGDLERIQDIQLILPTFLANVFNVGSVRIKTAAAGGDFTFDHVSDPRSVQRDIFHQLALYRRQRDLEERKRRFQELTRWFALYSEVTGQAGRPPAAGGIG